MTGQGAAPPRSVVHSRRLTPSSACLVGEWLQERLGQPLGMENGTGGGGKIGAEGVVRSTPDGYTLLVGGVNNAVNATLYEKLNFDFIRDIAPIAGLTRVPYVL